MPASPETARAATTAARSRRTQQRTPPRPRASRAGATPSATRGCSAWSSRRCPSSRGASSKLTGVGALLVLRARARVRHLPAARPRDRHGRRATRPTSVIKWLEQDRYYRWCTYLYLPLQYAGLVFACWLWSRGGALDARQHRPRADRRRWSAAIAINTAHELGHKRASLERWLSRVALAQSGYGHFFIEHNRGHHVRVATPEDPASARLGESFYAFLPRTVLGQPALGLGARAHAPARAWAARRGRRATTSSTRGR